MLTPDYNKLDNPVWYSLNETHKKFSINYDKLKCYHPDFCPFGGYQNDNAIAEKINKYAKLIGNFFIVGNKPGQAKAVCHHPSKKHLLFIYHSSFHHKNYFTKYFCIF